MSEEKIWTQEEFREEVARLAHRESEAVMQAQRDAARADANAAECSRLSAAIQMHLGSSWAPIATAPRDGRNVLLARWSKIYSDWMYEVGKAYDRNGNLNPPFSHWMPLPEPPKQKE